MDNGIEEIYGSLEEAIKEVPFEEVKEFEFTEEGVRVIRKNHG